MSRCGVTPLSGKGHLRQQSLFKRIHFLIQTMTAFDSTSLLPLCSSFSPWYVLSAPKNVDRHHANAQNRVKTVTRIIQTILIPQGLLNQHWTWWLSWERRCNKGNEPNWIGNVTSSGHLARWCCQAWQRDSLNIYHAIVPMHQSKTGAFEQFLLLLLKEEEGIHFDLVLHGIYFFPSVKICGISR